MSLTTSIATSIATFTATFTATSTATSMASLPAASNLRSLLLGAALAGAVVAAWSGSAHAARIAPEAGIQSTTGSLDRSILTATSSLSSAQQSQLQAFVDIWGGTLADSTDQRRLDEARRVLIDPLRDPASTAVFRRAISQLLIDRLEATIAGNDAQRAIHAMQVVRFLRTPESVDVLTSRVSPERESDVGKRLAASSILASALSDAEIGQIQFDGASRAIAAASEREENSLVLLQNLRALAAIQRRPNVPPASAELARITQVRVLRGLIASLAARSEADERMSVVNRALVALRNQWLEIARPDAAKLGPVLAPALGEVLEAAGKHWESARRNESLRQTYAGAIASAETLLRIIDRNARPNEYRGQPEGEARVLEPAWQKGDRAAFDAELARWKTVLAAAPYR
jgi:hypothetical protein